MKPHHSLHPEQTKKVSEPQHMSYQEPRRGEQKEKNFLELVGVESARFLRIKQRALRDEFLLYRLIREEFKIIESGEGSIVRLEALHRAYEAFFKSDLYGKAQDTYSKHSKGLAQFAMRSDYNIKATGSNYNIKTLGNTKQPIDLAETTFGVGEKGGGVEPGRKLKLLMDLCLLIAKDFPVKEDRWMVLFTKYEGNLLKAFAEYADQMLDYLIKGTYTDVKDGQVKSNTKDLKRSASLKECKEKYGETVAEVIAELWKIVRITGVPNVNLASILEVMGNDIAGALGAMTQEQVLHPGTFPDEHIALLMRGTWIKGATDLGGTDGSRLAGDTGDNKYLVTPVVLPADGIEFISDDSIEDFAWYLLYFYYLGDWDAIGSKAQNKMIDENGNVIVIDCGKAFSQNMIDQVLENFKTNQKKQPKNFSIFTDVQKSKILRGIFRFLKLKGDEIDEAILNSYGKDFVEVIKNIEQGADELIFSDYTKFLEELKKQHERSYKNVRMCGEVMEGLKKIIKPATTSRNQLVDKFKKYTKITGEMVDVVENIEKIIFGQKNTSLLSPDGKVILNHIRVTTNEAITWEFDTTNKNEYVFTAKVSNKDQARDYIKKWAETLSNFKVECGKNSTVEIRFDPKKMKEITECFSEKMIMQKFHPKQYKNYEIFQAERKLQRLIGRYLNKNEKIKILAGEDGGYTLLVPTKFLPRSKIPREIYFCVDSSSSSETYTTLHINRADLVKVENELEKAHKEKIKMDLDLFKKTREKAAKIIQLKQDDLCLTQINDKCTLSIPHDGLFNNILHLSLKSIDGIEWDKNIGSFPIERLDDCVAIFNKSIEIFTHVTQEMDEFKKHFLHELKILGDGGKVELNFDKNYYTFVIDSKNENFNLALKNNKFFSKLKNVFSAGYKFPCGELGGVSDVLSLIIDNIKLKNENTSKEREKEILRKEITEKVEIKAQEEKYKKEQQKLCDKIALLEEKEREAAKTIDILKSSLKNLEQSNELLLKEKSTVLDEKQLLKKNELSDADTMQKLQVNEKKAQSLIEKLTKEKDELLNKFKLENELYKASVAELESTNVVIGNKDHVVEDDKIEEKFHEECKQIKKYLSKFDPKATIEFSLAQETYVVTLKTKADFFNSALRTKSFLAIVTTKIDGRYECPNILQLAQSVLKDLTELRDLCLNQQVKGSSDLYKQPLHDQKSSETPPSSLLNPDL